MNTNSALEVTRRHFFRDCGVGVGKIALAGLLGDAFTGHAAAFAETNPLAPRQPHFSHAPSG